MRVVICTKAHSYVHRYIFFNDKVPVFLRKMRLKIKVETLNFAIITIIIAYFPIRNKILSKFHFLTILNCSFNIKLI